MIKTTNQRQSRNLQIDLRLKMSRKGDKNQTILKTLLKENGNNNCADCKTATHPRWASWNLGIFICIRCSGIHRSMGTHISRVKSVDLDTWTDEQVASMVKWGNLKANQFWEARLPGQTHVPDDSKIENFIRTKYDLKKWAASTTIPNPSSISVNTSTTNNTADSITNNNNNTNKTENRKSLNSTLLDLEFGSPIAAPSNSTRSPTVINQASFSSSQILQQLPQQQQSQLTPPPQPSRDNSRPELKKSILSLYSTPSMASHSTPNFPIHNQQPQNFSTSSFASTSSNSNSLNGLSFGQPIQQQQQQQSYNGATISNNWNNNSSNPWTNVSSPSSATNVSNVLDDPFKNVWK